MQVSAVSSVCHSSKPELTPAVAGRRSPSRVRLNSPPPCTDRASLTVPSPGIPFLMTGVVIIANAGKPGRALAIQRHCRGQGQRSLHRHPDQAASLRSASEPAVAMLRQGRACTMAGWITFKPHPARNARRCSLQRCPSHLCTVWMCAVNVSSGHAMNSWYGRCLAAAWIVAGATF